MAEQAVMDGYGRVSHLGGRDPSSDRWHATPIQKSTTESWIERNACTLGVWLEDLDKSGGSMVGREALATLIDRVVSGRSSGLVVANVDRFARNTVEGLEAVQRMLDAGGRFVSVGEGLDSADGMPRHAFMFTLTMMFAVATADRERKREALIEVRRRLTLERGIHITNWTPTGYIRDPASLMLDLDEHAAPHVSRAYEMRADGASLPQVADYLASADVRTNRRKDCPPLAWAPAAVRSMLERRVYLGEAHWGRFVFPDAHPAITDLATWTAANRPRYEGPRPRKLPADRDPRILRGIGVCAACSYRLKADHYTERGEKVPMYRCRKRHQSGVCTAPPSIHAELMEREAVEQVMARHWLMRVQAGVTSGADVKERLEQSAKAVEAAKEELQQFVTATAASLLGADRYAHALREKERLLIEAEEQLEQNRSAAVLGLPENLPLEEAWDNLGFGERRRALSLLDHVILRKGRGRPSLRVAVIPAGHGLDIARPGVSMPLRPYPYDWDTHTQSAEWAATAVF